MQNNFIYTLDKIAQQVNSGTQRIDNSAFYLLLDNAVNLWCQELDFNPKIISYIYQGYQNSNMGNLIYDLWKESQTPKKRNM